MKITWLNIDNFNITRFGNFKECDKRNTLTLVESCCVCGDPYFTTNQKIKNGKGLVCSNKCSQSIYHFGKSINSPKWEGGYYKHNIPRYSTYHLQLTPYGVECRRNDVDSNVLEVKCLYCDKWYQPSLISIQNKIQTIKGNKSGERNLYCSDNCKLSCPIYKKVKYPKGHGKSGSSREVQPQPQLRKLVLERDNYKCVRCGRGIDEVQLHCHHLTGVELNPVESADVDNCITLCKEHHKDAHKDIGCRYKDLRRLDCE